MAFVTGCGCSDCKAQRALERARALIGGGMTSDVIRRDLERKLMQAPKVEPVAEQPAEKPPIYRAPRGLSRVKKLVVDFYSDPKKFADMDKAYIEYGELRAPLKSFEEASGLTHLGAGAYSDVYALDDKRVLKIVKTSDSGYTRFVNVARANQHNPHFPKIYFSGVWGGKTVYILEKLVSHRDMSVDTGGENLASIHSDFCSLVYSDIMTNRFISYVDKHIQEAMQILRDNNMYGDLGGDNVLFRGMTPVISDPCAEGR